MGNDIREYLDQWPSRWKVDGQVLKVYQAVRASFSSVFCYLSNIFPY